MLKNIVVAAALAVVVACAGIAAEVPGLATPGKLVVGLDDTFAPMGFRTPAGELTGFDIDLARAVGKQLGVEVVFQPVEWSAKELELATKNVDCLWNGMSRTPEREKGMTLSQDYLNNRLVVMTNPGVDVKTLDDLKGLQIGTQAASSSLDVVKKSSVYADIQDNLHEYATYDECILDMRAGRLDAMVADEVLGQYKNNNLNAALIISPVNFGDDFYVIGFRREADNAVNEALCKAAEGAIKNIVASGEGAEISKKWFGADLMLPIK